jgi:hypothetical protein
MQLKSDRLVVVGWLAVMMLTLVVALKTYGTYQFGTHIDDARYVILARSLISSDVFGLINGPGPVQPERYPFGYPLLLSLVMRLFPDNLLALKVPSLLATLLNVGLLFWAWPLLSGNRSRWWGVAVAGLYGSSVLVIEHAQRVMTEPVFTAFCLLALLLTQWRTRNSGAWWWTPAMALTLAGALFTRSVGVVLVATVFVYLGARVGRKCTREIVGIGFQMLVLAAIAVATTPVHASDLLPIQYLRDPNAVILATGANHVPVLQQTVPPTGASTADASGNASAPIDDVLWSDARFYAMRGIQSVALGFGGGENEAALAARLGVPGLAGLVGLAIGAVVLLGAALSLLRDNGPVFSWFGLAFLVALVLWSGKDERLLYPVAAQLHWDLLLGCQALLFGLMRVLPLASRRVAVYCGMAALVLVLLAASTIKSEQLDDSRSHAGDLVARTSWLKTHTLTTDVVMTEAPEVDYIYGERNTVQYPSDLSEPRLSQALASADVSYVLVAPAIEWQSVYKPHYSGQAANMLSRLEALAERGNAQKVYWSESDKVALFRVNI